MENIFTEYVRSLEEGGEPPSSTEFDRLWAELCRLLTRELKRRGLWASSPSYLGVYGFESWTAMAVADLAADCYVAVFLDRLRSLKAHLKKKPNIEGLVTLYARHFLFATQKRCDPLGFKVFDVLRDALQQLLKNGSIYVLEGPATIRNSTILGFSPEGDSKGVQVPFAQTDLATWSDTLLSYLLTPRGEAAVEAMALLQNRIVGLSKAGVEVFRFKELVDPLKADIRSLWGRLLEDLQGETATEFEEQEHGQRIVRFIALTQPEIDFEDYDLLDMLRDCVEESVKRLRLRSRTREYFERLWAFLHNYARDVESETLPSHRKLSQLLKIPRERFPELYGILSDLLKKCRADGSLGRGVGVVGSKASRGGSLSMGGNTRREELRLQTGKALASFARPEARTSGPQSGDLYILEDSENLEWLVLFRAAGRCLVVPADSLPFTGSWDVGLPRGASSGPLNLRCGFAVWVNCERFESGTHSGAVDARSVALAKARLESQSDLPAQRMADRDPDYEDWTRDVLVMERDALLDELPKVSIRRKRRFVPLALAAALFAAVVGLGVLQQQVEHLSQPSFGIPRHSLEFDGQSRAGEVLEIEPGTNFILLPMILRKVERFDEYFVEIVDNSGKRVWRSSVRERQSQYRLLVPRRLLPNGTYRFRLYGLRDGAEVLTGELERTLITQIK